MRKMVILLAVVLFLILGSNATAQERILQPNLKELGLSGAIDFEGPEGGLDFDISASYGYFRNALLELGVFANITRRLDGDYNAWGLGVFAEQHISYTRNLYPYAGLSVGVQYADAFDDDEYSLVFIPRVGLKWFLRDYIAIDTNLFLALATDRVYVNDRDPERWDLGLNIGLRVFFQ